MDKGLELGLFTHRSIAIGFGGDVFVGFFNQHRESIGGGSCGDQVK